MTLLHFTDQRKTHFCRTLLSRLESALVFVDVGSGGPLKHPWTLLPEGRVEKVDFDPEVESGSKRLPLCISNQSSERSFFVARDPRASSMHQANPGFVNRFGQEGLLAERTLSVRCVTLDQHFAGAYQRLDFFDINTEGHDFQVLQGSERLFESAFLKAVKVEFEFAEAWIGQGWFSDIDGWMRHRGFELMGMDIDYIRPARVSGLYHPGEPAWGKALYVPGLAAWRKHAESCGPEVLAADVLKAVALYTILDSPGRAIETLQYLRVSSDGLGAAKVEQAIVDVFRYARWDATFARILGFWPLLANRVRALWRK